MAYNTHNFQSGDLLSSKILNEMDNEIAKIQKIEKILDEKQNKLTAGKNVKIVNDCLSAMTVDDLSYDAVCPEGFGAIGDGISDDTDAIINCLKANKNVRLSGIYKITKNIVVTYPINLYGYGTIIGNDKQKITFTDKISCQNITFDNIEILVTDTSTSIKSCKFINFNTAITIYRERVGVSLEPVCISDCSFISGKTAIVNTSELSNANFFNTFVINNFFNNCMKALYFPILCTNVKIAENTIVGKNLSNAIVIENCDDLLIAQNKIDTVSDDESSEGMISLNHCRYINIVENYFNIKKFKCLINLKSFMDCHALLHNNIVNTEGGVVLCTFKDALDISAYYNFINGEMCDTLDNEIRVQYVNVCTLIDEKIDGNKKTFKYPVEIKKYDEVCICPLDMIPEEDFTISQVINKSPKLIEEYKFVAEEDSDELYFYNKHGLKKVNVYIRCNRRIDT